jgi:hypothetical protein
MWIGLHFGRLLHNRIWSPCPPATAMPERGARFLLAQRTKTGKNIPDEHKIYQMVEFKNGPLQLVFPHLTLKPMQSPETWL